MRPIDPSFTLICGALLALLACVGSAEHEPNDAVVPAAGTHDAGGEGPDSPEAAAAGADSGSGAGAPGEETGGSSAGTMVGRELTLEVGADTSTFVDLDGARSLALDDDDAARSTAWDLRFRGWDIFTNGGASGGGKGAAFGPLPFTYFVAASDPTDVPFLIEDKAAGAFRDWYLYDGQWHSLYSRFHVYGVKSGSRLFKLQLLGYYGDVQGAPVSALYRLRYAEVTPESNGDVTEISSLDATAGGLGGDDGAPSGCLSLVTGERLALTPAEAAESSAWDLSFRRDSISVNGGLGGPGDVTAVDLGADASESETLDAIEALTPENQAERFDGIDYAALTAPALKYRGDRIVSAFSEAWVDPSSDPPSLAANDTWLVVGADGKSRFLVAPTRLERATSAAPGRVVLRVVRVR